MSAQPDFITVEWSHTRHYRQEIPTEQLRHPEDPVGLDLRRLLTRFIEHPEDYLTRCGDDLEGWNSTVSSCTWKADGELYDEHDLSIDRLP